MIDIVFFDAGDTLLRPLPSFPGLAAKVLRNRGHDVDEPAVVSGARAVSSHFRRVEGLNLTASRDGNRAFWTELYTDLLAHLGIADEGAPSQLYETFSDPGNYALYDDSVPVLDELAARGVRCGVISNFEPWLEGLLKRLGVLDRFEVVAISGVVGAEKPDPAIFRWAIERAGAAPSACMHVGDQPYFDADPALALGMRPVLIDRYGRFADLEADYPRIASLGELAPLIA